MSEEYVRKDVYDANMAEIRALMAASESRHERLTERVISQSEHDRDKVLARFDRDGDVIAEAISHINSRLDDMNRRFDRFINITTILLGVGTLVFTALQLCLAFK